MQATIQLDTYRDSCLQIEYRRFFFAVKGTPVPLSRTEFKVLSRLIRGMNAIVTFEDIWTYAWGPAKEIKPKNIHVTVSRVRCKLAPFGVRVHSVVGMGYILSHGSCCDEQPPT